MSLTLLAASLLSASTALYFGHYKPAVVLLLGATGPLAALWLNRQGRLRAASRILLSLFLAALSYLLYVGDGSHSTVVAAYPVTLVIAALLLDKREFAAYTALAMLSVQAIAYGELRGFIVNNFSQFTEPGDLIYIFVILLITAASASLLADGITRSISRACGARQALEGSMGELQREIAERERVETSLHRQARQMRQILDTVPEGVLLLDSSGRIVQANPPGERDLADLSGAQVGDTLTHLGGLSVEELLVRPSAVLWHDVEVQGRSLQIIARPTQGVHRPPGSQDAEPEHDGGDWVVVIRDVTREQEIQQRLRQQDRLAVIGRLAGGVAHDFNNILTAIQGYAGFVLDRLTPEDPNYADLREVRKGADRAASLTGQLLAFSRKQVLRPRVLDLNAAIVNVEEMLRRLIGEDIQLNRVSSPDLGHVMADPGRIEQVIVNLAVNARDAMPRGGHLTLETRNVVLDEAYGHVHPGIVPGAYVVLSVSDTGAGMTEEVKSHLFEPFFTTKEVGKGTGLGLSTVHGIVTQSGGHIEVYSELGLGTTFKIYLPQVRSEAGPTVPTRSHDAVPRGTETVLVVEDEGAVRRLTCRTLEEQGYTVLAAEHPDEALHLDAQHPGAIHLLVTDVVMPGMVGSDLAKRLVASRPEIKVLYTSGYTDDAIVHHGVLDPEVAFLGKPFTPTSLAGKVREVLDRDAWANEGE
jgi:signal transduction histidine kinase/ActR/RegA family two-component response regulator